MWIRLNRSPAGKYSYAISEKEGAPKYRPFKKTHGYNVEVFVIVEGSVELHDAVFALEQQQGVSFPENASDVPLVELWHGLERI